MYKRQEEGTSSSNLQGSKILPYIVQQLVPASSSLYIHCDLPLESNVEHPLACLCEFSLATIARPCKIVVSVALNIVPIARSMLVSVAVHVGVRWRCGHLYLILYLIEDNVLYLAPLMMMNFNRAFVFS